MDLLAHNQNKLASHPNMDSVYNNHVPFVKTSGKCLSHQTSPAADLPCPVESCPPCWYVNGIIQVELLFFSCHIPLV